MSAVNTLYIEEDIAAHPVTRAIVRRFARATCVPIRRYTEVFNQRAQNFRLQKQRPALILARKFESHVLPTPAGYGVGAPRNYYFSHMLNCFYDCRYCFLQGMYSSANYVVFVNFEDFESAIERVFAEAPSVETCFFSGYDCDSLAFEPVTGFVERLLPFFARRPMASLELRTKSTQIRSLLRREPLNNVIAAFSFTPGEISEALEHKVPQLQQRIAAMATLQERGWPVGIRFDPLLYDDHFRRRYGELFEEIFRRVDAAQLHSVSLGSFRMPRGFFRRLQRLYPDEPLLAAAYQERSGMVSYPDDLESEMRNFCSEELRRHVPDSRLFYCEY